MSFHVEFYAEHRANAIDILRGEHLPPEVRLFITKALEGCAGNAVYVKAVGHLTDDAVSYNHSFANIEVKPIVMSVPRGRSISE